MAINADVSFSDQGAVYMEAGTGRLPRRHVFHPGLSFRLYERRDGTIPGT